MDVKQAQLNAKLSKNEGDLFIYDGNKLKKISPLEIKHNNLTFEQYLQKLEYYKDLINTLISYDFLDEKHNITSRVLLDTEKSYTNVSMKDNYIIAGKEIKGIIVPTSDLPINFDNGCYTIKNHKVTLDKIKLQQRRFK